MARPNTRSAPFSSTLLASAITVAALQCSIAAAAGRAVDMNTVLDDAPEASEVSIMTAGLVQERASALLEQGRPVHALDLVRTMLLGASHDTLTDDQASRLLSLASVAKEQMLELSPIELSLQRAELSLQQGDLAVAELHASRVLEASTALRAERARASAVNERIAELRSGLEPQLTQVLSKAERDFQAGRYADAKEGFSRIRRSGIVLTSGQEHTLVSHLDRLVDLERTNSNAFTPTRTLGLLSQPEDPQPGVVVPINIPAITPTTAEPTTTEPTTTEPTPALPTTTEPNSTVEPTNVLPTFTATQPEQPSTRPGMAQPDPTAPSTYLPDAPGTVRPTFTPPPVRQPVTQPTQPVVRQPVTQPTFTQQPSITQIEVQARRLEAQALLAEADQAYIGNNWQRALDRYSTLLGSFSDVLDPSQVEQARQRQSTASLNLRGSGQISTEGVADVLELQRAQLRAEFDNLIATAGLALEEGDIAGARSALDSARVSLDRRQVLPQSEYEEKLDTLAGVSSQIDTKQGEIQEIERANAETNSAQAASDSKTREANIRTTEIDELVKQAREYQANGQYREALSTIEKLLFKYPRDPSGLLLRDVYQDMVFFERVANIRERRAVAFAHLAADNLEASVPDLGIVNFPAEWRSLQASRSGAQAYRDSAENELVIAQLRQKRVPEVEFSENTLQDALEFVRTTSGLNMNPRWNRLSDVGISAESTLSMQLTNIPIVTLLDRIAEEVSPDDLSKAGWAVIDGVVSFSSDEDIRQRTRNARFVYDISDLLIEIPDFTDAPTLNIQQALRGAGGGGGGGGGGQSPFSGGENNNNVDRRPLEDMIQEIQDIVQEQVDFEGWVDNGGQTGSIRSWGRNLIVTNTPRNHQQISDLLSQLRASRAVQLSVETRFLLVNQDFFEQIGFDVDVYLNSNNNQVRAARAINPLIQPSNFFTNGQPNTVVSATNPANPGLNNPSLNAGVVNPRPWSIIGVTGDSLGLTSGLAPASEWASAILGGAPALGLAGSFIDDISVDFLVKATQADRRSTQLTAPRLTFTNGQVANVFVGTQTAYISDLEAVVGQNAVGFDPTIDVATEGVSMIVEGTVSASRNYVTINVDTGVSRIEGFVQQPVVAIAGGQLVNSAAAQQFIQLPTVTVTRVQTTVNVPDQGTVLLGGQRLVTEFEVETGVPVLSKMPIINRFFTNRVQSKEEQTLLILIKPTVLIQSEQEAAHSPGSFGDAFSGF